MLLQTTLKYVKITAHTVLTIIFGRSAYFWKNKKDLFGWKKYSGVWASGKSSAQSEEK